MFPESDTWQEVAELYPEIVDLSTECLWLTIVEIDSQIACEFEVMSVDILDRLVCLREACLQVIGMRYLKGS